MSSRVGSMGLFPFDDGRPGSDVAQNVVEARNTGVLPYQRLLSLAQTGRIKAVVEFEADQFQPASLDLRLGRRAYRVRASFLPGPGSSVMDRVRDLDGFPAINLEEGAVLERGAVYVVELFEAVALNSEMFGVANPKSSTGRLDILTRLITDRATAFDRIEKSYQGPLFLEIAPLTFHIIARAGDRLSQVRFQRGEEPVGLSQMDTEKYYRQGQLLGPNPPVHPLRDGLLVPVTVDLIGSGPGSIVGYKAKKSTNKIDLSKVGHYDPRDYWDKIESSNGRLNLDEGDFYILATKEDVGSRPKLPPKWCHTIPDLVSFEFITLGSLIQVSGGQTVEQLVAKRFSKSDLTACRLP